MFQNSKPRKTNPGPTKVCFGIGNSGKQILARPKFVFKLETAENRLWADAGLFWSWKLWKTSSSLANVSFRAGNLKKQILGGLKLRTCIGFAQQPVSKKLRYFRQVSSTLTKLQCSRLQANLHPGSEILKNKL